MAVRLFDLDYIAAPVGAAHRTDVVGQARAAALRAGHQMGQVEHDMASSLPLARLGVLLLG